MWMVLDIVFVLQYFERKLNKTHASLSNVMEFCGYWRFMQIRQRIFNCTDVQLMHFILEEILKAFPSRLRPNVERYTL